MPKKASTKKEPSLSQADIERELIALDRITNALNTAIVALYYVCKVEGDELKDVNPDEYVDYITKHIHPLVRRADEISKEFAEKTAKEAEKAVKE